LSCRQHAGQSEAREDGAVHEVGDRGDFGAAQGQHVEKCSASPRPPQERAAVSRSEDYLAANEDADPLVALTEGFQSAFLACVVLAGIGAALALLLLGRPRRAPQERLEPVPASSGAE
jgi:hypothetical protein